MYNGVYVGEVIRFRNIKIFIYPKDHDPPHIHAIAPGAVAKFRIEDLECYYSHGFSVKDRKIIKQILEKNLALLKVKWDENK